MMKIRKALKEARAKELDLKRSVWEDAERLVISGMYISYHYNNQSGEPETSPWEPGVHDLLAEDYVLVNPIEVEGTYSDD